MKKLVYRRASLFSLGLPFALTLACGHPSDTGRLAALTPENLSGTWAKQFVLTSEASAVGIKSKTKTILLTLIDLKKSANGIEGEERVCDVGTLNSGASSITFPPAIVNAFSTRRYTYTFDAAAQTLSLKNGVEVLGARLSDPLKEGLPQSKDDGRVLDQDRDGKLGVTVKVQAQVPGTTLDSELYVTQRTFWQEALRPDSDTSLSSKVDWRQEQFTLNASNPIFTTVTPSVKTLPQESQLVMKKLPAGTDCKGLKAQASRLFNPVSI